MIRNAFKMKLKPGVVAEYKKRHDEIWPELAKGQLKPGAKSITAGKLGTFEIQGDNIMLGKPFIFNKENIDQFDF